MDGILAGKSSLVTGGGSGIGQAACLAFAREGASVCVVDRHLEAARQTASTIVAGGGRAVAIAADVAKENEVRTMMEEAVRAFGAIDCCFNNAGIGTRETNSKGKLLADIELSDWQHMLAVNLTGVFLCMKHEIRHMQGRGGSIVNTASIGGLTALAGAAAYVASKHGVLALTKNAAIEYGHLGIRVNAICPGHVLTPLIDADPDRLRELAGRNPMHRLGTSEEIAEMVVWLISSRASFTNGSAFLADGGRLAGA